MDDGFTLVELIIVMAIMAILAVIGSANYFNIIRDTRDSIRKADLYAISTALEVNKTAAGYVPLQTGQFSHLSTIDPSGNFYCIAAGSPPHPVANTPWGASCPSGFTPVAPATPPGSFQTWKVCTYFEKVDPSNPTHAFCMTQKQ